MPMTEGSNALKTRRPSQETQQERRHSKTRRVVSAKTMRIRQAKKRRKAVMPAPVADAFHALNPKQMKVAVLSCVGLAIFAGFLMLTVRFQMKLNEVSAGIETCQETLDTLTNDNENLMIEYKTKMNNAAIEEYARTEMGMHKFENYQVEWISISAESPFEKENVGEKSLLEKFGSFFH